MKYMTLKNIGGALFVLFLIALLAFLMRPQGSEESAVEQETATTTATSTTTTTTTTTATNTETMEVKVEGGATVAPEKKNIFSNPNLSVSVQNKPDTKKELGPRQPATVSPLAALQFAAEAAQAGDNERALTYFAPSVRESYRASFNGQYKGRIYPVLAAYLNGRTDPVEIIEPESGLYEIAVYPSKQGGAPFRVNAMFDSSVNEFVLTEL